MTDSDRTPFEASLYAGTLPTGASAPLLALWHGLRGDWQAAHEIVQAQEDLDSAWVHAWLHRVEGDLANADYWYHRAGRPVAHGETPEEGLAIARVIGSR